MKKIIFPIIVIVIIFASFIFTKIDQRRLNQQAVTTFEECEKAGYTIGESYPRQCFAPNKTFIEGVVESPIMMPRPGTIKDDVVLDPKISLGCKITGCSGQICSDQEVVTTCEFRPEYICYKNSVCERQSDNKCGWTITETLRKCLIK